MSIFLDKERSEKLSSFVDRSVSIKQRVSMLVNSLGEINPNPSLSEILKGIQNEEYMLKNAYRAISDEIRENVFQFLAECNNHKTEALKIDYKLLDWQIKLNKCCSIYSKVPPLLEHKNDVNYEMFMEMYEKGVELSQKISQANFKIVDLLDVQKVLDDAFAGELIELEYLTSRLSELIKSFRFVKTPKLVENYKNKFCSLKSLQELVDDKQKEFEEFRKKLEETKNNDSHKKIFTGKESVSVGFGRDFFED